MSASMPVWAQHVSRVAVLTGAGVSTASGIPDYRGPDGVWTRDPSAAEAFTYDRFMTDAQVRQRFWRTYVDHAAWGAEPNPAHRAIASLDRPGLALRVLTQNVDGLQQRAGLAERKVLELHGTMHRTDCTGCRRGVPTAEVRARARRGRTIRAAPRAAGFSSSARCCSARSWTRVFWATRPRSCPRRSW